MTKEQHVANLEAAGRKELNEYINAVMLAVRDGHESLVSAHDVAWARRLIRLVEIYDQKCENKERIPCPHCASPLQATHVTGMEQLAVGCTRCEYGYWTSRPIDVHETQLAWLQQENDALRKNIDDLVKRVRDLLAEAVDLREASTANLLSKRPESCGSCERCERTSR